MSKLLDDVVNTIKTRGDCDVKIGNRYYIAKGMRFKSLKADLAFFINNLKDAWRVIRGKSFAVHYKEDE